MIVYLGATLVVPVALALPAALAFVTVRRPERRDPPTFLAELPAFALAVPLFIWLVQHVVVEWLLGVRPGNDLGIALWGGALAGLAAACTRARRWGQLVTLVRGSAGPLGRTLLFVVWCAALAGWDVRRPITRFDYWHVSSDETFGTYWTHDNYFQFVNGRAIARGEPFQQYYGKGKLVYPVTAREMLPGVIYAAFRDVVRGVERRWEDSFGLYLVFGIAWNATIVLALEALGLRLGLRLSGWLILALLSTTSLWLVNGYFTWFKLAGAALFIGGLLEARDARGPWGWAWAGVLWGAASDMHQSALLGIPLFALWYAARAGSGIGALATRLGAAAAAVAIARAPWEVVKAVWFSPDFTLFAQHYLNGLRHGGVLGTALYFLRTTPLTAQVAERLRALAVGLRLPETLELATPWRSESLAAWATHVAQYRFLYSAIAIYPLLLLAAPGLWRRIRAARPGGDEVLALVGLAAATLVGLWLAHFSFLLADQTSHLPLAVLALLQVLLAAVAAEGRAGAWLVAALCALEGTLTVWLLVAGVGQASVPQALVRYAPGRWLW